MQARGDPERIPILLQDTEVAARAQVYGVLGLGSASSLALAFWWEHEQSLAKPQHMGCCACHQPEWHCQGLCRQPAVLLLPSET